MNAPLFSFLRRWNLRAPVTALQINKQGNRAALALASGEIVFLTPEDTGEDPLFLSVHEGVVTSLIQDADCHAFLSGGADGRIQIVESGVVAPTPLAQSAHGAVRALAATPSGLRAFADSVSLHLLDETGEPLWREPFRVTGIHKLVFNPDGTRLVLADDSGWRLLDLSLDSASPRTQGAGKEKLQDCVWNPNGESLYFLTEKNQIDVWSFPEKEPPCLAGVRPLDGDGGASFLVLSAEGRFLMTGGGAQVFALPLDGGEPWKNPPLFLGETGPDWRRIVSLAPHPREALAAIGYQDGSIVLAPFDGRKELPVFPSLAPEGAKVVGLGWSARGDSFLAALENGLAFLFTLKSVGRFVRSSFV